MSAVLRNSNQRAPVSAVLRVSNQQGTRECAVNRGVGGSKEEREGCMIKGSLPPGARELRRSHAGGAADRDE